jgi:hypothetical protein
MTPATNPTIATVPTTRATIPTPPKPSDAEEVEQAALFFNKKANVIKEKVPTPTSTSALIVPSSVDMDTFVLRHTHWRSFRKEARHTSSAC